MTLPSIESRLRRRFVLMSTDPALEAALREALPPGWEMVATCDLDALGGFEEILQHRFLILDLDEHDAFDPLEVVRHVRMDLMLNLAILCLGGAEDVRGEARLARADRFFERSEAVEKMLLFCRQYGWGAG